MSAISKELGEALNNQVLTEFAASQFYLNASVWCHLHAFTKSADYFEHESNEEVRWSNVGLRLCGAVCESVVLGVVTVLIPLTWQPILLFDACSCIRVIVCSEHMAWQC